MGGGEGRKVKGGRRRGEGGELLICTYHSEGLSFGTAFSRCRLRKIQH